jgi:hypothetical protein
LPVPVSDGTNGMDFEEALQNLDKIDYECLRKSFQDEMNALCELIKNSIAPKKINNHALNGKMYAKFLQLIVQDINADQSIFLYDNLNVCMTSYADEIFENVKSEYLESMNELVSDKPISWADFFFKEQEISSKCLKLMEFKLKSCHMKTFYHENVKKFMQFKRDEDGNGVYKTLYETNKSKIEAFNFKLAKTLWKTEMKISLENIHHQPIHFKSRAHYKKEIASFKHKLNNVLFESDDVFWPKFKQEIKLEQIEEVLEMFFDKLEKKEFMMKAKQLWSSLMKTVFEEQDSFPTLDQFNLDLGELKRKLKKISPENLHFDSFWEEFKADVELDKIGKILNKYCDEWEEKQRREREEAIAENERLKRELERKNRLTPRYEPKLTDQDYSPKRDIPSISHILTPPQTPSKISFV